ncbi:hypothetical protein GQ457_05G020560 [Hibiscus cannabinus]
MNRGNIRADGQHDHPVDGNVGALARPRDIRDHLTPILDDLNSGIVAPEIQAAYFELKPVIQADDESMYECWDRYKRLLRKCTNHDFQDWTQVVMFYNGVNAPTRMMLDASANGTLLDKSSEEAFNILDRIANNDYQFPTARLGAERRAPGKLDLDASDSVSAQLSAITNMLKNLQKPTDVRDAKALSCVHCERSHHANDCPTMHDQGQRFHISQQFNGSYDARIHSSTKTLLHDHSTTIKSQGNLLQTQEALLQSHGSSLRALENQVGQIAQALQVRPQGSFPSDTEVTKKNGKEQCSALTLRSGIIYPISDSEWVSPVQCVPKKGGITVISNEKNELIPTRTVTGWRVRMDYRKLNKATRKDHFPLPFIDQMLDRLVGKQFYCFLDGYSGYNQITIAPEDQSKTTFTCPYETFAFRRMPFGLCNAPSTFQRWMTAIFSDLNEDCLEIFMDDFSTFGEDFDNCLSNLEKVLIRCKETNLVLNWEKCHFMVDEGIVLGHKISSKAMEVERAKIDVISKLPPPTTVKGIRSLLGHAGFYRRFIEDFSKITKPLCSLMEQGRQFEFNEDYTKAFKLLKNKLVTTPIVEPPDWTLPFELMCDASDYAIGAVLRQRKGKVFHPIYYASKTLNDAQVSYTTTKKELLAVIFAFDKF